MEDNLQHDKLEEFLNNSFERYSEEPPGDLWDKIADGLEPAPVKSVRPSRWWWALAAVALVAGLFTCQHLYFSNQINSLEKQLERNDTKLKALEKDQQTHPLQETGTSPQAFEQQATDEKNEAPANDPSPLTTVSKKSIPQKDFANNNAQSTDPNDAKNIASTPPIPLKTGSVQLPMEDGTPPLATQEIPGQKNEATVVDHFPTAIGLPGYLPAKNASLLAANFEPKLALAPAKTIVEPAKQPGNFSIGIHAMPMATREKITSLRGNSPSTPGGRKVFNETKTSSGETIYAGLIAEYKTSPNFYLGSGLDYRRTSISSSHRAELKFKDRRPHGAPHMGQHEHGFQYDLNTSTGLVEVEIRAEQPDTTVSLPDTEDIGLSIHTRQELTYLSIPLYGRYEWGKKRLRFFVKGGVIANFLMESDFRITGISSENPRLRFDQRRQPRGTQQNLQTMTLDYLAGFGADYALTDRLKLRLEPSLSGSLTSNHNNRFIQSSQLSLGANAGLMYVF